MFYKYIDENRIVYCPKNGKLSDGRYISNLWKYLADNESIRICEGYYELVSGEIPEIEEGQELKVSYKIIDGKIREFYEIISDEEEE
ncbi:MAG: hypothetical protein NC124_02040 [Clostridium sp.]|nr:hypothetical protein [Clostridium sp.]